MNKLSKTKTFRYWNWGYGRLYFVHIQFRRIFIRYLTKVQTLTGWNWSWKTFKHLPILAPLQPNMIFWMENFQKCILFIIGWVFYHTYVIYVILQTLHMNTFGFKSHQSHPDLFDDKNGNVRSFIYTSNSLVAKVEQEAGVNDVLSFNPGHRGFYKFQFFLIR